MVLRDVACARGSNAHAPALGVFVTEQKITAAPFCTVVNARPDPCDARTLHAVIVVLEVGPAQSMMPPSRAFFIRAPCRCSGELRRRHTLFMMFVHSSRVLP